MNPSDAVAALAQDPPSGSAGYVDALAKSANVLVVRDVMVPMRDGVCLAVDIYFPAREGSLTGETYPVLLARTPYDKRRDSEQSDATFFAEHDYVAVVQDCRGRFKSDGTFRAYKDEARDGYDTVQWLSDQPFCNGMVGTHGCSYGAWVQLQLATQNPPALKAMIPHTGPNNAYYYSMHVGGTRTLGLLRWHLHMMLDSKEAQRDPSIVEAVKPMLTPAGFLNWASELPWRRGCTPLSLIPAYEDSAFGFYFEHADYDDFWRDPSLAMDEYFDAYPRIPILWLTGWYEVYARSIIDGFNAMVKRGLEDQHVVAGPWTHNNFDPANGDANYGPTASTIPPAASAMSYKLAWFDRWLKGSENGDLGERVKMFVMGGGDGRRGEGGRMNHGGRWVGGDEFPFRGTEMRRLYLTEDGTLVDGPPTADESATTYTYDPRRTVHSDGRCEIAYGPAAELGFAGMGPYDQVQMETLPGHGSVGLPVAARRDVLVFQTPPLSEDLTVAGQIAAVLHVSSDAPDTDFFVKVIDVYPASPDYPTGYAFPVTDGVIRARYRSGFAHPTVMTPGEIYELRLPLQPVANVFKAEHRLRIDISSSSFPNFDINPNTGDSNGRRWRIAENTVHHDSSHPSYIEVPAFAGVAEVQEVQEVGKRDGRAADV